MKSEDANMLKNQLESMRKELGWPGKLDNHTKSMFDTLDTEDDLISSLRKSTNALNIVDELDYHIQIIKDRKNGSS